MKKVLKFLDDFYPTLILITLWSLYEYFLVHNLINLSLEIFNNKIERPCMPFYETVSDRILYCVLYSFIQIIRRNIITFLILLLMKYMAKHLPIFNKKVYKILLVVTAIIIVLFFILELICELWWHRVI
jgi:sterol desaturase/sphingolipid hydroxylase (fatty acid hydroxylase superfamily)